MTKPEVEKILAGCTNLTEAAVKANMPRTTFREMLGRMNISFKRVAKLKEQPAAAVPMAEETMALRQEVASKNRELAKYMSEHGHLESLIHQVVEVVSQVAPPKVSFNINHVPHRSDVDACLHLTDIHYGAVQPGDEVEGFGEYSPAICEKRMENLFQDFLDFITIQRNGYNIRNLHILCTGDYISGDIQDLRVTNEFPAPVQAVQCGRMLAALINGLTPVFDHIYVHVVTDDNHGRLTKKPQAKEGGTSNWSYVVGKWIEHSFTCAKNVTVNVISKPWESVQCCGRRYLLTHGHHVSGWMGFPYFGIERLVAREALKRMNAPDIRKFHKVVLGHWHAPLKHPSYFIGGAVSGTDAYDHGQGRFTAAQQTSWLIHPKHGEFAWTEWNLRN